MSKLRKDRRLYSLLLANTLSSMGTGMMMIAIPWLFVQQKGGSTVFGTVTIVMAAIMFLTTPYVGMMIDRFSRKSILMSGEGAGFIMMALFAVYGLIGHEYETWHLAILFASGSLYYLFFYPTLFAFTQEIFSKEQYKQLNGIMEIQGQFATVLSGGVASLLIGSIELEWLLIINAATFVIAFFCVRSIDYKPRQREPKRQSFWGSFSEGYHYMRNYPILFIFLFASLMPFIGVMMTNYLHPIFMAEVLHTEASAYGLQSMIYGIGAAFSGLVIPKMLKHISNEASIIITMLIYAVGTSLYVVFPTVEVFFILTLLTAFGNAGTRVARGSLLMEVVPNGIIGRIDGLFRTFGLLIRMILLLVFTGAVTFQSVIIPYIILSVIMICAFTAALLLGRKVRQPGTRQTNIHAI